MLKVDKSDQLIAYNKQELWVRRYWEEIMYHCLDILIAKAYIIHKSEEKEDLGHKYFLVKFIEAIIGRAESLQYGNMRATWVAS